mgnify:CR=1 FL=1
MNLVINNISGKVGTTGVEFYTKFKIGGDDSDFGFPIELNLDAEISVVGDDLIFESVSLVFEDDDSIILPSNNAIVTAMNSCETLKDYVKSESKTPISEYLAELAEGQHNDDLYERAKQSQLDGELS